MKSLRILTALALLTFTAAMANVNVADYVLGSFTADERIILSQVFPQAAELFAKVLTAKDAQRLIPEWGKKKLVAEVK